MLLEALKHTVQEYLIYVCAKCDPTSSMESRLNENHLFYTLCTLQSSSLRHAIDCHPYYSTNYFLAHFIQSISARFKQLKVNFIFKVASYLDYSYKKIIIHQHNTGKINSDCDESDFNEHVNQYFIKFTNKYLEFLIKLAE